MLRIICSIALTLAVFTSAAVAWSETHGIVPPRVERLLAIVPHCSSAEDALRLGRKVARAHQIPLPILVARLNHEAEGGICRLGPVDMTMPIRVSALELSIWDVWVYKVTTPHGDRYVPLVGRRESQNL